MAYIYKIINDINDKVYIGKTELPIEQRFKQHCLDAFKVSGEQRPLYNAMQKYGTKHFSIELIEKTEIPEQREQFWIKFYNSYIEGYNATLGGDGKTYIDYNIIVDLWNQGYTCKEIAAITHHDRGWVSVILKQKGISPLDIQERARTKKSKSVLQIDPNTNAIIDRFSSGVQAAIAMIEQGLTNCKRSTASTHISEVCRDKRNTFAGFNWKFDL